MAIATSLEGVGVYAIGLTGRHGGVLSMRRGSVQVDGELIQRLWERGAVPILSALAIDEVLGMRPVASDGAASAIAHALGATLVEFADAPRASLAGPPQLLELRGAVHVAPDHVTTGPERLRLIDVVPRPVEHGKDSAHVHAARHRLSERVHQVARLAEPILARACINHELLDPDARLRTGDCASQPGDRVGSVEEQGPVRSEQSLRYQPVRSSLSIRRCALSADQRARRRRERAPGARKKTSCARSRAK